MIFTLCISIKIKNRGQIMHLLNDQLTTAQKTFLCIYFLHTNKRGEQKGKYSDSKM